MTIKLFCFNCRKMMMKTMFMVARGTIHSSVPTVMACTCHGVCADETCLDCLRSKVNIGRWVQVYTVLHNKRYLHVTPWRLKWGIKWCGYLRSAFILFHLVNYSIKWLSNVKSKRDPHLNLDKCCPPHSFTINFLQTAYQKWFHSWHLCSQSHGVIYQLAVLKIFQLPRYDVTSIL